MTITFAVSDVARAGAPKPELVRAEAIPKLLGAGARNAPHRWSRSPEPPRRRVEAFSATSARLVSATDANAFAQAAHDAFYEHRPLKVTPDAIWFCIARSPRPEFWRSFFRYQSGSGPSEMTGWILTLFPYIEKYDGKAKTIVWNEYMAEWEQSLRKAETRRGFARSPEGPALGAILPSIASAPVRFVDLRDDTTYELRFVAGMIGVTEDLANGELAPEFAWAVVHEGD